jgi:hypothetical protein
VLGSMATEKDGEFEAGMTIVFKGGILAAVESV